MVMERLNDAIEPVSGLVRTLHSVQQNDVGVLTSPRQTFSSHQDIEKKFAWFASLGYKTFIQMWI